MEFSYLLDMLEKLKTLDEGMFVQGSHFHKYLRNEVIDEELMEHLEKKYRIILPENYRKFLMLWGNGGAGPEFGVYRLQQSLEEAVRSNWSLDKESILTLDCYYIIENIFEKETTKVNWLYNGCLPIAMAENKGFYFLILNGNKKGQVWKSNEEDSISKCAESFTEWYQQWLALNLTAVTISSIKEHFMISGEIDTILYEYYDIRLFFEDTYTCYDDLWMQNLLLPLGLIHSFEALGWLYLCEENYNSAIHYFRLLYTLSDEKLKAAGGHGLWSTYILQGRVRDALKIGEITLAISRYCNDIGRIYEMQYGLSLTYAIINQREKALKAAEELVEIFPIINASFEVLASLHIKFNDKKLAKKSLARLINKNPLNKNQYSRKLWQIYRSAGATEWSHWISQIMGSKDEKKMAQKIETRREELKRVVIEKFGSISSFLQEEILKINYIDELENLIDTLLSSKTLEEFEITLFQYTK